LCASKAKLSIASRAHEDGLQLSESTVDACLQTEMALVQRIWTSTEVALESAGRAALLENSVASSRQPPSVVLWIDRHKKILVIKCCVAFTQLKNRGDPCISTWDDGWCTRLISSAFGMR
jgi:hypothetical protein